MKNLNYIPNTWTERETKCQDVVKPKQERSMTEKDKNVQSNQSNAIYV